MRKNLPYILVLYLLLGTSAILRPQGLTSNQIDSLVDKTFESLPQAGIAFALVKDGKVIYSLCDALATFNYDTEGKATSIKMKGISPNIDFSFDFQDLNLVRVDWKDIIQRIK